ncbi:hypothetical protein HMPREF9069_01027 [Atopobium sp. oral taxon 810 str. F0209]|nr:hypothetical protein HMPREF9069_01027 [Atopobium sp. oral taxon 810 str. F0209]
MHPSNHDKGCVPCIAKNLKEKEIPSCFFNLVGDAAEESSFFFEDFARLVLKKDAASAEHECNQP